MSVQSVVLLVIVLQVFLLSFSLATIYFSYRRENASEFKETFVFRICSVILEETEWKYMSIIMLDAAEMELSEDFMTNFHDEVWCECDNCMETVSSLGRHDCQS